jgi:alpha-glucosidase
VFGGASWEWDARRGQYYFHNFLKEQPDLNLYNEEVQAALIEAGRFWLDRGVDGFRLDALNFGMHDRALRDNPPSGVQAHEATRPFDMQLHEYNMSQPEIVGFIEAFREMLNEYPETFTVAEVGGPNPIAEMKAFTEGEARLNSAYNFDFLYAPKLGAERVKKSASLWDQSAEEGWPSWAFSNHDAPRAVTRWAPSDRRDDMARLYMLLLLTLRGNPIIYQGEELGLPQADVPFSHLKDPEAIMNWPKTLGRDGARTPIPWEAAKPHAGFSSHEPWLPLDPEHAKLAVDQQQGNDSMLRFTAEALGVRKRYEALLSGRMAFEDTEQDSGLIVRRTSSEGEIIALFNFGDAPIAIPEGVVSAGSLVLSSRPLKEGLLQDQAIPGRVGVWVRPAQ